jgi:hypothetical protein
MSVCVISSVGSFRTSPVCTLVWFQFYWANHPHAVISEYCNLINHVKCFRVIFLVRAIIMNNVSYSVSLHKHTLTQSLGELILTLTVL